MAERRPVRSSSRPTTSQASIRNKTPSPPQQTKRITRGQSREISDTEAGLGNAGNAQKARRNARGSSVESVGGKRVRNAKKSTQTKAVQGNVILSLRLFYETLRLTRC